MSIHGDSAKKRWQEMTLSEQLGNIGSEVSRAMRWQGKDDGLFGGAVDRALELFDFTLDDSRWRGRMREIARARELFCDAVFGENKYKTSLRDLLNYFNQFAYIARASI